MPAFGLGRTCSVEYVLELVESDLALRRTLCDCLAHVSGGKRAKQKEGSATTHAFVVRLRRWVRMRTPNMYACVAKEFMGACRFGKVHRIIRRTSRPLRSVWTVLYDIGSGCSLRYQANNYMSCCQFGSSTCQHIQALISEHVGGLPCL